MGMLQVKNLPDELHRGLAERARAQGISMSEYVTRLLRRDLSRPTVAEWVAEQRTGATPPRAIDVVGVLDEVRVAYDAHLDERETPGPKPASTCRP